jgi:hypothetical protein
MSGPATICSLRPFAYGTEARFSIDIIPMDIAKEMM